MKTIRIIVAGSRKFTDKEFIFDKLDTMLENYEKDDIEFISGMAHTGPDAIIFEYAESRGYPKPKEFPADWDNLGKSAGYVRNVEMAKYGTHAAIFWDGESKGSAHMFDIALQYRLTVKRYIVKG